MSEDSKKDGAEVKPRPRATPVPNSHEDLKGAPLASEHFHGVAPATAKVAPEDLVADSYVLMVFPKTVRLCLPNHSVITFPPGIHKVPTELADHWYFEKNGVKRHA